MKEFYKFINQILYYIKNVEKISKSKLTIIEMYLVPVCYLVIV